jgi:CRISPR/Cas system-associated endoribonuclease Cas2
MVQKVLFSLPDQLVSKMRTHIPNKQRSKVVAALLEKELERREQALYECALEVEADETLNEEMKDWEETVADGIVDDSW